MAQQVIKSDKTRQPYCEEKIFEAVFLASSEAGLSYEKATQLGHDVTGILFHTLSIHEVVTSSEIQEEIYHVLLNYHWGDVNTSLIVYLLKEHKCL